MSDELTLRRTIIVSKPPVFSMSAINCASLAGLGEMAYVSVVGIANNKGNALFSQRGLAEEPAQTDRQDDCPDEAHGGSDSVMGDRNTRGDDLKYTRELEGSL